MDHFWFQNGRSFAVESGVESVTKPKLDSKGDLDLTWDYSGSDFKLKNLHNSSPRPFEKVPIVQIVLNFFAAFHQPEDFHNLRSLKKGVNRKTFLT